MAEEKKLIINSPYEEPAHHWEYDFENRTFREKKAGRRPAGYVVSGSGSGDTGVFVPIPLVNEIRRRVKEWREKKYKGVTGTTRTLLEHWHSDSEKAARENRFFFCQLDAIETLIRLVEAPETERTGIEIIGDGGGLFTRICTKLCTGGGKTAVMAMLIAWQVCNKAAYRQDPRFSRYVLVIAPNLTVKSRLKVLETGGKDNYYEEFHIVPRALRDKLSRGKVVITNWHTLKRESGEALEKKKSVDKRGPKSDNAFAGEVLGGLGKEARSILVINDEAHHAWRYNPENSVQASEKQKEEATVWVEGLDRIHRARKILTCYDFSATPFAPSGKKNKREALFSWIVSDFGLNDGIESGLVKTPRVVIRDDTTKEGLFSKFYHLYDDKEVKESINETKAPPDAPLPDLVIQAYNLLGADWRKTYHKWTEQGAPVPPVMITAANSTKTAARIEYAFAHNKVQIPELCEKEYIIHIDSDSLEKAGSSGGGRTGAEGAEDPKEKNTATKKGQAEALREQADTVGKKGRPGGQIRNVISVGMLTEGWDAKNVTHILGLRAFRSQLLCEQVVGRGLRRLSYEAESDGLFAPEYVNVFGIPFSFLPCEEESVSDTSYRPKTPVEALADRAAEFAVSWPNIKRVDREYNPRLNVDMSRIEPLTLEYTPITTDLASTLEGKYDLKRTSDIDLEEFWGKLRMQELLFKAASQVYEELSYDWKNEGTGYALLGQVFGLVERFIGSGKIVVNPPQESDAKTKLRYKLQMDRIVKHLCRFISLEKTDRIMPVLDTRKTACSTGDMGVWFTAKPNIPTRKSHISRCVYDSE